MMEPVGVCGASMPPPLWIGEQQPSSPRPCSAAEDVATSMHEPAMYLHLRLKDKHAQVTVRYVT